MPFMFAQPVREASAPYVTFKDIFSPEECHKIIAIHRSLTASTATIGDETLGHRADGTRRRTEVYWIHWDDVSNWIYKRLSDAVIAANNKWWGFHLSGMMEAFQLTRYRDVDHGFYDWHEDHGHTPGFSHRKLSLSLALNDGYVGGNFEFLHTGKVEELKKGSIVIFPSYMTHRVTPVTKGDRWSLVSWISGPPFV